MRATAQPCNDPERLLVDLGQSVGSAWAGSDGCAAMGGSVACAREERSCRAADGMSEVSQPAPASRLRPAGCFRCADLVAGSGIDFRDRGTHSLKGVPGVWELDAVKS
jgi:hypothetical protein